jgi:hypothetical protein
MADHSVDRRRRHRGSFVLILALSVIPGCGDSVASATPMTVASPSPLVGTPGPTAIASVPMATGTAITDRYPDGLPRTIDGAPVLRGAAALAYAQAVTDDTPFLIAGWVTWVPGTRFCSAFADGSTWLRDCGRPALSDVAGAQDQPMTDAITFRFVLGQVTTGPIVVQVRVHDPRATACGSAAAECDRMMAALAIAWTGDKATAPRPLSIDAVEDALRGIDVATDIVLPGSDLSFECGNGIAAADVYYLAAPPRVYPLVTAIEILPSVAARERALDVPSGASGSLTQAALTFTGFSRTPSASWSEECRWLALSNVALLVRTHHGPTKADRAFLDQLAAALEHAAPDVGK